MKALFQKWLFVFVSAAFVITFFASWRLHSHLAENSAMDLLESHLMDVYRKVKNTEKNLHTVIEMSDAAALAKAHAFAELIAADPSILNDKKKLEAFRIKLDVDELHVSDDKGILTTSIANKAISGTESEGYLNYDMASSPQSAAFMPAITDPTFKLVQKPQPNGALKILFQYAGVARIDRPGIVQIGYRPSRIEEAKHLADVKNIESEMHIGLNGTLKIAPNPGYTPTYNKVQRTAKGIFLTIVCDKYLLTAGLPREEIYISRNSVMKVLIIGNLIQIGRAHV